MTAAETRVTAAAITGVRFTDSPASYLHMTFSDLFGSNFKEEGIGNNVVDEARVQTFVRKVVQLQAQS